MRGGISFALFKDIFSGRLYTAWFKTPFTVVTDAGGPGDSTQLPESHMMEIANSRKTNPRMTDQMRIATRPILMIRAQSVGGKNLTLVDHGIELQKMSSLALQFTDPEPNSRSEMESTEVDTLQLQRRLSNVPKAPQTPRSLHSAEEGDEISITEAESKSEANRLKERKLFLYASLVNSFSISEGVSALMAIVFCLIVPLQTSNDLNQGRVSLKTVLINGFVVIVCEVSSIIPFLLFGFYFLIS
jgi:hypothetical protein